MELEVTTFVSVETDVAIVTECCWWAITLGGVAEDDDGGGAVTATEAEVVAPFADVEGDAAVEVDDIARDMLEQ